MKIMKWRKCGKIELKNLAEWQKYYQMLPTPFERMGGVLRIYTGFCDSKNIGRIGYVDVKAENPSIVLAISDKPVMDIGRAGAFDDNGVVPVDILRNDDKIYLYYVGFQSGVKVPYYMFGGLAISKDEGETFHRVSESPILDRTNDEIFARCGIFVRKEDDLYKMWYIGTTKEGWTTLDGKLKPLYTLKYTYSEDGIL